MPRQGGRHVVATYVRRPAAYANATGVGLTVMPTHGRHGIERFLLGSGPERVVRRGNVSVLTLHPGEDSRNEHPYQNCPEIFRVEKRPGAVDINRNPF